MPRFDPAEARRLLREAGYRGEPIPYRLLNNYYTNQNATAQVMVEMWRSVGLNVQIEMKENWSQILERSPTRARARLVEQRALQRPRLLASSTSMGRTASSSRSANGRNEEMNRLSVELETSTDRARRRASSAACWRSAEREDPAYTVLHQNATFTAKRRDIRWKASPAFAMDFRAGNWGA